MKRLKFGLDLQSPGLEYGPLHRAIVSKDECPLVRYVDCFPRDELVAKYLHEPSVDTHLIPEIDIVTAGKPVEEFVEQESQSWIVASHVIEHVPDFAGWLEGNLKLLKPGGVISLACPDRRFTFDINRNPTDFSEVVAAYIEQRTRPSFTQICDYFYNVAQVDPRDAWSDAARKFDRRRTHPDAVSFLENIYQESTSVDIHCWTFTDEEFLHLITQSMKLISIDYEIVSFLPTRKNTVEFFCTIQRANE